MVLEFVPCLRNNRTDRNSTSIVFSASAPRRPTKPCDAYRAQATIAQIRVIVAFALPNMRTLYVSALSLIGIKEEAFRR